MHSIFLRQGTSGTSGGGGGATETSGARATDSATQTEAGSSTPAESNTSLQQSTTGAPDSSTQRTSAQPETTSTAEQTSSSRQSSTASNTPDSTSEGPTTTSNNPTPTSNAPTSTADSQTSSSPSQISASNTATASDTLTQSATRSATSQAPADSTTASPATSTPAPTQSSGTSSAPGTTTSGVTSIVVTVVSSINGTPTTFTTLVPTLATNPNGTSVLTARTSAIVGGVVGGTLALISLLILLFYLGRRRRKLAIARSAPRLQAPRQMLDTDDFDLAEPPGPAPYPYGMVGARASPNASGSIFHEVLPGTAAHHSHTHTRSLVNENDPLLLQHLRGGGGSVDVDSIQTSSPRESTHYRASSSTGLLFDPNDPFGDPSPISAGSGSSRTHPAAIAKAREARSRAGDPHVYPPSAYHGPPFTHADIPHTYHPTSSGVLVHQDAGRVDVAGAQETPPGYTRQGRSNYSP